MNAHDRAVRYLIDRRFPDADEIRDHYYCESYPCSPEVVDSMREIEAYERELSLKPSFELYALEIEERAREDRERFYNQRYANADFSRWSKLACWSLDEAVALSLGKSPDLVCWAKLIPFEKEHSPFVTRYYRLRDLVERAKRMGLLSEPIVPASFVAWAKQNEIELPSTLEAAVVAWGNRGAGERRADLHPKERETVLKLIIAMAMKGYAYKPGAARSDIPADITNDVHALGLTIDQDTVRKWLKEASEVLPQLNDK